MGSGCQAQLACTILPSPANIFFLRFPLFIQELLFTIYGSRATNYFVPAGTCYFFYLSYTTGRGSVQFVCIDNFLACIFVSSCPVCQVEMWSCVSFQQNPNFIMTLRPSQRFLYIQYVLFAWIDHICTSTNSSIDFITHMQQSRGCTSFSDTGLRRHQTFSLHICPRAFICHTWQQSHRFFVLAIC